MLHDSFQGTFKEHLYIGNIHYRALGKTFKNVIYDKKMLFILTGILCFC